jgi:2-iminobutanoate/2-iminopropanoate deaminase
MREIISTPNAPAAIGPYSQAVKAQGFVYCSGQVPIDPATGKLVEGDVEVQARQVLKNLSAVLSAAGTSLAKAVKAADFLHNVPDFAAMNKVYRRGVRGRPAAGPLDHLRLDLPARRVVEIEVVALAE